MSTLRVVSLAAIAAGLLVLAAPGTADETGKSTTPRFAMPKKLMAGRKAVGVGRYYPSPVLHDVNGDGRADVVTADLFGKVTVALRQENGSLAAETPLNGRDGKPLKFHNW